VPTGFAEAAVATGLTNPTAMEFAPDGRLFVLEQAGDRAYLAMHGPLAPLLAALVLIVAYGFLHFLANTI